MNDFYIGLITTLAVIVLTEALWFVEKRLIAAMTLVGIAFIYIGFSWADIPSLVYTILGVSVFFLLACIGYKKNFICVLAGLVLHGVWDMLFPLFSSTAPEGYDIFCVTIDLLLPVYFYIRVKPLKRSGIETIPVNGK